MIILTYYLHIMKKILFAIGLMFFILTSCSSPDNDIKKEIIGTWSVLKIKETTSDQWIQGQEAALVGGKITFFKKGIFIHDNIVLGEETGTYKVNNGKITLDFDGDMRDWVIYVEDMSVNEAIVSIETVSSNYSVIAKKGD